jgi:hypothetical protein
MVPLDDLSRVVCGTEQRDGCEGSQGDIVNDIGAYKGEWNLTTWNAQGLLASCVTKQQAKMRRARSMVNNQDILIMEETHGNEGKCMAVRIPKGYKAFWSNGEEGEAGVCAWVRESFLKKIMGDVGGWNWIEVVKGRAAILMLGS